MRKGRGEMAEKEKISSSWNRHTLVWIRGEARKALIERLGAECQPWQAALLEDGKVPGIICRQPKKKEGIWLVGFSGWMYDRGMRRRMTAEIEENDVLYARSPFEILEQGEVCRAYPALALIVSAAERNGIQAGLYGSTAMEWVSGRPYRRPDSDYDLYIRRKENSDLNGFYEMLRALEAAGVKTDVEIEVNGYGVKLKEYMSGQKTVLGKGLYDVVLMDRLSIQERQSGTDE